MVDVVRAKFVHQGACRQIRGASSVSPRSRSSCRCSRASVPSRIQYTLPSRRTHHLALPANASAFTAPWTRFCDRPVCARNCSGYTTPIRRPAQHALEHVQHEPRLGRHGQILEVVVQAPVQAHVLGRLIGHPPGHLLSGPYGSPWHTRSSSWLPPQGPAVLVRADFSTSTRAADRPALVPPMRSGHWTVDTASGRPASWQSGLLPLMVRIVSGVYRGRLDVRVVPPLPHPAQSYPPPSGVRGRLRPNRRTRAHSSHRSATGATYFGLLRSAATGPKPLSGPTASETARRSISMGFPFPMLRANPPRKCRVAGFNGPGRIRSGYDFRRASRPRGGFALVVTQKGRPSSGAFRAPSSCGGAPCGACSVA